MSVIIPTTGRKERAVACVKQLLATVQPWLLSGRLEVICVVDADPESFDALNALHGVSVYYSRDLQGCSRAWNMGLSMSSGEYVVIGADDLWFTDGWLDEALLAMTRLPDACGLVGLNDGHGGPDTPCTHWLAHREFLSQHMGGVMAFECYKFCCNDTEAHARAVRANRYVYAPDALVRHDHPAHGTRPLDETDRRNQQWAARDLELYYQREAQGFPNDFDPVVPVGGISVAR